MNILGNLIWLIFGGIIIFLEYIIAGVVMMLTIIGIPWGLQCFKLGVLALWPFGSEVRETHQAAGCLNTILNIIWILVGGIWIALTHMFFGIILVLTIIGLTFANQHFKIMSLFFTPFGNKVFTFS